MAKGLSYLDVLEIKNIIVHSLNQGIPIYSKHISIDSQYSAIYFTNPFTDLNCEFNQVPLLTIAKSHKTQA